MSIEENSKNGKKSNNNYEGETNSTNTAHSQDNNHEETQTQSQNQINDEIIKRLNKLEEDNAMLKKDNAMLKEDNKKIHRKLSKLETLIMRNNANIDLLVNRDSMKTILLLFLINEGVTKINFLYTDTLGEIKIQEKFTNLVIKGLKHFGGNIPKPIIRKGVTNTINNNNEIPKDIKEKIIFIEFIHFVVCTIDNIIHPPNQSAAKKTYSKIIGKRGLETLSQGIQLFFENPKTIDDLEKIMGKQNEMNNSAITFENYDIPKNIAYLKNKQYYLDLNRKNLYYNTFFIQYLFDPNKNSINEVNMEMSSEKFNIQLIKVINDFKKNNTKYDPIRLIENLKWN